MNSRLKVKVCGMRNSDNIRELIALPIDYIGFIFYAKSPRYASDLLDVDVLSALPSNIKKTGVFVNADEKYIQKCIDAYKLNVIQLHGGETPEFCRLIRGLNVEVIKAFQVSEDFDFNSLNLYQDSCDFFLFDTKTKSYGGSGHKFNWELLKQYNSNKPLFLSGGIDVEDAEAILRLKDLNIYAIDINSKFEIEPALKDVSKIKLFMKKINMEHNYNVDKNGRYGKFGGAYIPEMLQPNISKLESVYLDVMNKPEFKEKYLKLLKDYVGRPTPLYYAERLSDKYKTNIYLKREDLNHTGAHKINNSLGQILLAKELGKKRIIAETGAGQHGVATATACALMGIECVVYMGALDIKRQAPNVARMKMLGASVVSVVSGNQTLKDATNEALRDWICNPEDTFYIIGSVVGPHPYPDMVARFQSIISQEIKTQLKEQTGKEQPDYVIACVGGGSNASGSFYHFLGDEQVKLIGVEAYGLGVDTDKTAATIALGDTGIIHGSKTFLIQNEDGQIIDPYSISAGLDYPGIGPQHAHLKDTDRATYLGATDQEALDMALELTRLEGIIPAIESAHALAVIPKLKFKESDIVVITVSGRGDKDMDTYLERFGL